MFTCRYLTAIAAFLLAGSSRLFPQDTIGIEPVTINGRKAEFASAGRKTEAVDSAFREQFRFTSVAEMLSYHSVAHLRTYGNGGISMAGIRGASAEQTAVLWNGMNLQNTMLGLTDLSMAPALLFESATLEYGSSASVWGSGAVGGSIHLDNQSRFAKKFSVASGLSAGNIGQMNTSVIIHAGERRFVNVAKLYTNRSRNTYRYYRGDTRDAGTMSRAAYQGTGFMNEMKLLVGKYHILNLNAWLTGMGRQIPGYDPSVNSKQYQDDAVIRLQGTWVYSRNRRRAQFRSAYFNERVGYTDSIAGISNTNKAETFMSDAEQFYLWGRNQLHTGISFLRTRGRTENYNGKAELQRISLLAGNRFDLVREKLAAVINGRAEYFTASALPVTGNLGVEYTPGRWIKSGVSISTSYRQPTLNELYWLPGGNRALLPERSSSADANIRLSQERKGTGFSVTLAAFTRTVTDWIIWTPGARGMPTPMNIQEVWSRGAETTWEVETGAGGWNGGFRLATSYVLSTVVKNYNQNNASIGKQLIYTPRYMATGNVHVAYRATSLYLICQYAGYRFTTSDNSDWLDPYTLVSLRMQQAFNGAGLNFRLYAACNNLFNKDYVVMDGRWMPLRHFEFGVTIRFNKKQDQ